LNDLLRLLNRSADAVRGDGARAGGAGPGRAESLALALDRLRGLVWEEAAPPQPRRSGPGDSAELERLIHLALDRPDHKLAAYGTLVPGERNHDRVAALGGSWQRCYVRGRRWTAADGDPAFRWSPDEPEVEAMLLVSDRLPSAWADLDRFEGSPYRRHLVPVRAEETHHVAYLYESVGEGRKG
jgi:gamma-glutamylcyclotransferase (GGCT)/AIG2-like uncharacterized protein YtfP